AAGGAVVYGFNAIAAEHARIGTPRDHFTLRLFAGDSLVVAIDGADHLVVLADARTRNRNISFEFQSPVRILSFEIQEHLLDVSAGIGHRNRGRDTYVEKEIRSFRSATRAPGVSSADPAEIH